MGVPEALGITRTEWAQRVLRGYALAGTQAAIGQRREAVAELSEEGMSQRAIADVLGVAESTVRRDKEAGAPYGALSADGTTNPQADDVASEPGAQDYAPAPGWPDEQDAGWQRVSDAAPEDAPGAAPAPSSCGRTARQRPSADSHSGCHGSLIPAGITGTRTDIQPPDTLSAIDRHDDGQSKRLPRRRRVSRAAVI